MQFGEGGAGCCCILPKSSKKIGEALACTSQDFGLRVAIEEKAGTLGCADEIFHLASIDAVRFLQHKERCTPCFGWESPLIPLPEGASAPPKIPREKLCGVLECYWKLPCDMHRIRSAASLEECMDEKLARDMEGAIVEAPGDTRPADDAVRAAVEGRAHEAAAAKQRSEGEQAASAILTRIAESAGTFLAAIQELAQQGVSWRNSAGQQLEGLTARFEQLAEVVFEQQVVNGVAQERYEELCQAMAASREAHAHHESDVQLLREGIRERMDTLAGRVEELSGQLGKQREQVAGLQVKIESLEPLHSTVADLSSKVNAWCERLDKQGEVLHALCEAQNQRAAVLDEFLGVLSRLRAATAAPAMKL